jgi:hypothetical protein
MDYHEVKERENEASAINDATIQAPKKVSSGIDLDQGMIAQRDLEDREPPLLAGEIISEIE